MENQNLAYQPTYLDAIGLEFHEKLKEKVSELTRLYRSNKVNAAFFCNKNEGGNGFLKDLFDCLSDNGIYQFSQNLKPELTQERELPIREYADLILSLPKDCLRTLRSFHQKISSNEDQNKFPTEYRKISNYFIAQNKASNDSAEGGRLILTLSSIGELVLEMKDIFTYYTPKTLGFIQTKLNEANKKMTQTMLSKTDSIRLSINTILDNLKTHQVKLAELTQCIEILTSQKREFVRLAMLTSLSLGKTSADKVLQAERNLQTWIDWENIVNVDTIAAKQIHNKDFAKTISDFKKELVQYLEMLFSWIHRIQNAIQRKETVSPFYLGILNNLDQLIKNAFSMELHIEPEMRTQLKKLQATIANLKKAYQINLRNIERNFRKYPDSIQTRLNYLNTEIPKILLRANPLEVKYMTLTVNASYKNVRKSIEKAFKGASIEELDKMTHEIHLYYSKIVQNATELIKVTPIHK